MCFAKFSSNSTVVANTRRTEALSFLFYFIFFRFVVFFFWRGKWKNYEISTGRELSHGHCLSHNIFQAPSLNSACQDEIIVSLLCDLSIKFKAEKISVVVVVFLSPNVKENSKKHCYDRCLVSMSMEKACKVNSIFPRLLLVTRQRCERSLFYCISDKPLLNTK